MKNATLCHEMSLSPGMHSKIVFWQIIVMKKNYNTIAIKMLIEFDSLSEWMHTLTSNGKKMQNRRLSSHCWKHNNTSQTTGRPTNGNQNEKSAVDKRRRARINQPITSDEISIWKKWTAKLLLMNGNDEIEWQWNLNRMKATVFEQKKKNKKTKVKAWEREREMCVCVCVCVCVWRTKTS